MALTIPAPLSWLSDVLRGASCRMDLARHDETSRNGAGQLWTAELARPTWFAELTLAARDGREARAIDAKIRALGPSRPMLFADPSYEGPAWGQVWRLKAATVAVGAIKADRTALSISGLPAGYRLSLGDRLSIAYAGGARNYLGELVEGATALSGATTAQLTITPPLPAGIAAGAAVELARPVCRMIVPPDGYTAFDLLPGVVSATTSLRLEQKV